MSNVFKTATILATLAAVLGGTAYGSVVTIQGSTTGSFLPAATGMSFTPQTNFTWTTNSAGTANVTLGTLSWGTSGFGTVQDGFNLTVAFTEPGTTPASKVFTADLWARNVFNAYGNVDIWFDDVNATHSTYTTDEGTYSFDLSLVGTLSSNAYEINEGGIPHEFLGIGGFNGSVQVTGQITNATFTPIPEPAALSVVILGGLAVIRRRFRT